MSFSHQKPRRGSSSASSTQLLWRSKASLLGASTSPSSSSSSNAARRRRAGIARYPLFPISFLIYGDYDSDNFYLNSDLESFWSRPSSGLRRFRKFLQLVWL